MLLDMVIVVLVRLFEDKIIWKPFTVKNGVYTYTGCKCIYKKGVYSDS